MFNPPKSVPSLKELASNRIRSMTGKYKQDFDLSIIKKGDIYLCNFENPVDKEKFLDPKDKGALLRVAEGISPRPRATRETKDLIRKFMYWNRYELVYDFYILAAEFKIEGLPMVGKIKLNDALLKRLGGVEKGVGEKAHEWAGLEWDSHRCEWVAIQDAIRGVFLNYDPSQHSLVIHRQSVISFLQGEAGHTYTGLVVLKERIGYEVFNRTRPKIFLIPVQPSIGGARAREIYSVRPHAENFKTKVYKKETPPVVHQKLGSAHGQLAALLNLAKPTKFGDHEIGVRLDTRGFVGFTVSKGIDGIASNRYAFTSQSANTSTFALQAKGGANIYTSKEWGEAIKEACDRLINLEHHLLEKYKEKEAVIRFLSDCDKEEWRKLREEFWPSPLPLLSNSKAKDEDDEWI